MNVETLVNNPAVVDELIAAIDAAARKQSSYEYGLPLYEEAQSAMFREIVYRWAAKDRTTVQESKNHG